MPLLTALITSGSVGLIVVSPSSATSDAASNQYYDVYYFMYATPNDLRAHKAKRV